MLRKHGFEQVCLRRRLVFTSYFVLAQTAFQKLVEDSTRVLARAYAKNNPTIARGVVADW
jgi:hypothetical protein